MSQGPIRKGAGQLRHRVALQSATPVIDELGGRSLAWSTYATVWAAVEPQSQVVGTEKPTLQTVVTIRYRSDVVKEQRVVALAKTYEILEVIDPEKRHRELILPCAEVTV